ncbi:MAG: ABC transporter permease [Acidobacteriota bacterium]
MDELLQDLRYAGRSLANSPGFTIVVVITLALAIGSNSAIFSVIDGVLLRPLPYDESGRIVRVAESVPGGDSRDLEGIASQRLFLAWRENGSSFERMAMYSNQTATMTGLDEPVRVSGLAVSPSLFPLLRVDAVSGRTFTAQEDRPGNDGVVLLSHRAWQRYFGGDPDTLGRQIILDDRPRTVVGIMPSGFAFPDASVEFWVPLVVRTLAEGENPEAGGRSSQLEVEVRTEVQSGQSGTGGGQGQPPREERQYEVWGRMVGRLATGVSLQRAAEEGNALVQGLHEGETGGEQRKVSLVGFQEQIVRPVRSSLLILMGAVGFVLLIACANVANLFLARSAGRRKETAVRAALGAGRLQLVRFLLLESLLLVLLGGALGLVLAYGSLSLLDLLAPEFIPRLDEIGIDIGSLEFTLVVSLLAGMLFSLVPARSAVSLDLVRSLKESAGATGRTKLLGRDPLRKLLVAAEVALSVVLLVGAGLLVNSFVRLVTVDPGYDTENVLHLQLRLPPSRYASAAAHINYYEQLVATLGQLGGVESATVVNQPPTLRANMQVAINVQGRESPTPARRPSPVGVRLVGTGYFDTLGMRVARGRGFEPGDRAGTQPVVVLSQSGARTLFGSEDPVGGNLPFFFFGNEPLEIVGVVDDARIGGVDPKPQPEIFIPYQQGPERMIPAIFSTTHLLVRTRPDPLSLLPAIRTQLRQIDATVLVFTAATLRDQLAESVAEPRFYASLVTAFAALALALAAVGIYGLLSYSVQQRLRETAIRKALGASAGQILQRVVAQGMVLAALGLLVGLSASVALTRLLESMLYEIGPTDAATLAAVSLLLLLVALVAVYLPARRAIRIDPMDVLRYEG